MVMNVWAMLGCATSPEATVEVVVIDTGEQALAEMDATRLLTRASLDLRGVRPDLVDLQRVQDDPTAVDGLVQEYVDGDAFGESVARLFAPVYQTDASDQDYANTYWAVEDETAFLTALGQEPLQMLGRIAAEDLPYTDLFTADWTMHNEAIAAWAQSDYPAGETGWQVAAYTDGRPMAGVLSSSGLWWAYQTTTNNANRGRANAVASLFLCRDYLAEPIAFDETLDLLDDEAVRHAIRTNEACLACHNSLDPLGAFFWGFYDEKVVTPLDHTTYNPERELLWQEYGAGYGPAYAGQQGDQVDDLGWMMASDPRTIECVVQHTFEQLLQREVTLDDTAVLTAHREAFLAGGLTLRSLLGSVIDGVEYRAGPTDDVAANPWKLVSPALLSSQVEGLTGFVLSVDGYDLIHFDHHALRTLSGGAGPGSGGEVVGASPTLTVVAERMTTGAAWYVADNDAANPAAATLFTEIDWSEGPGDSAFDAQMDALHLRVLGRSASAAELEWATQSWSAAIDVSGDPVDAWAAVLAVLMRHPEFLVY